MTDLTTNDIDSMRDTSTAFMPLTCSIFRPEKVISSSGDIKRVYPTDPTYTDIPADIIEITAGTQPSGDQAGGFRTAIRWEAYIPVEYDIQNDDKLVDNLGRTFAVTTVSATGHGDDYDSEIIIGLIIMK